MGTRTEEGDEEAKLLPACGENGMWSAGSSCSGEKCLHSAYILEVKLPGFSDVVCECERSHGCTKIFGLSYWEGELFSEG